MPRNSPLFFSPLPISLSLSLSLQYTGWSARVAEGRKGGCTSLERVNTAHRSGTHKYTVSQRESGTKSIARTYAVVYACTRTHPPHPEDTGARGGREAEEREKLSIFPAAFTTSRKPRFSRKNTRPCMGRSLLGT